MVVHLKTVTGECYCGCRTQPEKLVDRWAPANARRCLRCVRKLLGLRINAKMRG